MRVNSNGTKYTVNVNTKWIEVLDENLGLYSSFYFRLWAYRMRKNENLSFFSICHSVLSLFFLCSLSTLSCISIYFYICNQSYCNTIYFMLIPYSFLLFKYLWFLSDSTSILQCPTMWLLIHECIPHMTKTSYIISIIIALLSSMFLTFI